MSLLAMSNSSTEKTEILRAVKAVSLDYILTAFVIMVSINLSTLCDFARSRVLVVQ